MKKTLRILLLIAYFFAANLAIANVENCQLLLNDSFSLNEEGKLDESIVKTNLIVENYVTESVTLSRLRVCVAAALALKGVILSKQAILNNEPNKNIEAISSYDLLLKLYENNQDTELQYYISTVLVDKGNLLSKLQKYDLAIESYNKEIEKFKSVNDTSIQIQVADAMINKGKINTELKNYDEALNNFNAVFNYKGTPDSEVLQDKIGLAIYGKSTVYMKLNRLEDEIACYDEYIKYFHEDSTKVTDYLQSIFSKIEKQRNIAIDTKKLILQ